MALHQQGQDRRVDGDRGYVPSFKTVRIELEHRPVMSVVDPENKACARREIRVIECDPTTTITTFALVVIVVVPEIPQ